MLRPDGKGVLAADIASNRLCVMDQDAQMIVKLPLAVRPDNLCYNVDGGQLFITGEGRDAVVVVFPYYVPQVAKRCSRVMLREQWQCHAHISSSRIREPATSRS